MPDINYQPPQTTGSEILGYHGDPALAGGFDSRGQAIGNGEAMLTPVSDMLKLLQGQQFLQNQERYKQAIKDRDDAYAAIQDPSLQVPIDVSDKDRPELMAQHAKLIDMWKKNPSMDDTDAFVQFKKATDDFRQMAGSSKSRNLEFKKQMQAIAAESNLSTRASMLQHLDEQMNQGILHPVNPYFNNPTFDASMFTDVPEAQIGEPEIKQDANGAWFAIKKFRTPVQAFSSFVSPENLLANNGQRLQQFQILHDNFIKSPFAQDENNLTAMNQKLASINAANNLTPNDPNFLQPIASNNGSGWKVNDSPAQFAKSLYAYSHYKEHATTEQDDKYQIQMKGKADIGKIQAETVTEGVKPGLIRSEAAEHSAKAAEIRLTAPAIEDHYRAMSEKLRKEGDLDGAKTALMKSDASSFAAQGIKAINDAATYVPYTADQVKKMDPAILKGLGRDVDLANQDIVPLPRENTYMAALSLPKPDKAGNVGGDIEKPYNIYALRPKGSTDPNEVRLVAVRKTPDASGTTFMKAVRIGDIAGEIIKYHENFKSNDKTVGRIETANKVTQELMGKPAQPASATGGIPEPVKKLPSGETAVPINVPASGTAPAVTVYKIGAKYYDVNGNEVKE